MLLSFPLLSLILIYILCGCVERYQEMLKFTEEGHKDFKNLEAAYERLEMVVTIVNEAIRQAEDVQKMLNIQGRFAEVKFPPCFALLLLLLLLLGADNRFPSARKSIF